MRFGLLLGFLEEYRWEDAARRRSLLAEPPPTTAEQHWDVLLDMEACLSGVAAEEAPE